MKRTLLIIFTLLTIAAGIVYVGSIAAGERRDEALRVKGYPTSLAELNEWYVYPTAGENAADYYIEAGNRFDKSRFPETKRLAVFGDGVLGVVGEQVPADELELTTSYFAYHEEAYMILAHAAAFEDSRYPIDFAKGPLAHRTNFFTPIEKAWRALLLKFYYHCHQGQTLEAIVTYEQFVHFTNSLDDNPSWFGIDTRLSPLQEAIRAAEHILSTLPLKEDELIAIDNALASLVDNDHMLRVAVGYRCLLDTMYSNEFRASLVLTPTAPRRIDQESYAFINLLERPTSEIIPELLKLDELPQSDFWVRRIPGIRRWTRNMVPAYASGHRAADALRLVHEEARIAAGRGAIRIARARAAGNPLPEHVQDLPGEHTEDWPVDPFTNEPIRYQRLPSGFITYSVGRNLKDDIGEYNEAETEPFPRMHASVRQARDAVFRVLHWTGE